MLSICVLGIGAFLSILGAYVDMPESFLDLDPQSVHFEPQLHQPTNHKDVGIQYGSDNSILFKIF